MPRTLGTEAERSSPDIAIVPEKRGLDQSALKRVLVPYAKGMRRSQDTATRNRAQPRSAVLMHVLVKMFPVLAIAPNDRRTLAAEYGDEIYSSYLAIWKGLGGSEITRSIIDRHDAEMRSIRRRITMREAALKALRASLAAQTDKRDASAGSIRRKIAVGQSALKVLQVELAAHLANSEPKRSKPEPRSALKVRLPRQNYRDDS